MEDDIIASHVEVLAHDIEQRVNSVERVITKDHEVFVEVKGTEAAPLANMDKVCTVAHDHGFVPCGIIDSGAARFQPRTECEHNV